MERLLNTKSESVDLSDDSRTKHCTESGVYIGTVLGSDASRQLLAKAFSEFHDLVSGMLSAGNYGEVSLSLKFDKDGVCSFESHRKRTGK